MNNITHISDYRRKKNMDLPIDTSSKFFDQEEYYMTMIDNKMQLFQDIMEEAYMGLTDHGLNPDDFEIEALSLRHFLTEPFDPETPGARIAGPTFVYRKNHKVAKLRTYIEVTAPNEYDFIADMYGYEI